ncbi:MAG: PEP-CTERM sorting domain-containing protein [Candidatus Tectomicrobia bacterium]|uniref:PEP-CTERM sorting domain-containing protein n=1 Tax=Tectimicrobiota bacterium TaxID=2528274 RepID=A0A932G1Z7_UNCTE|nr:PEP-CTERM sorting domain-containing protein [Candidatus Tectomicrobia bacterium]
MMKRLTTFLSAWILSVALLWSGGSAWALSFSTSTATINLDALSFTFNGAPIQIILTDVFSDTPTSTFVSNPEVAFASALAESSSSLVRELVNAAAQENSVAAAQALALRSGVFESPGEGLLTVTVPFSAFSFAFAGTSEDEAIAAFGAEISLGQGLDGIVDTDSEVGFAEALGGGFDFAFSAGFLSASILFEEGQTGFFEAQVANFAIAASGTPDERDNNVVPEPTSLLLLGSGLVGFGVWRRRQGGPSKV